LEWAPVGIFSRKIEQAPDSKSLNLHDIDREDFSEQDGGVPTDCTIFVKNLSFSTDETQLRRVFEKAGAVRAVSIPRRPDNKSMASGFGFVEFKSPESVEVAMKKLQNFVHNGRAIEIKLPQKRLHAEKGSQVDSSESGSMNSKLLVRNVAFEATSRDIRELFSSCGALKSLRMPKKHDGSHRGFAFVEFINKHEAVEAKKRLASTHLYGRHLVLEWVEDSPVDVEGVRERAVKHKRQLDIAGTAAKKKIKLDLK